MPISKYFGGNGSEVMNNMLKEYGPDKGKQIFYALNNKRKKKNAVDYLSEYSPKGK